MSSEGQLALSVEGLSKRYRMGGAQRPAGMFAERLNAALTGGVRRASRRPAASAYDGEERFFWALRDVNLQVAFGEVVGIIGRNGAGKSTLLKLLSRITPPTEGRIRGYGRTATLLEVGTGFHPELSGRENVFLNGSLLGMKRLEIARKYDEIVEFSGIEPFIEVPVKRYSSGMYVRLAFAVAAHLEPEILIIDEVLAVGDLEFQKRCLEKMESAAREGRAVVFVSHDMGSVSQLCDRVFILDQGRVTMSSTAGRPEEAVIEYVETVEPVEVEQHEGVSTVPADVTRIGSGEGRLIEVALLGEDGRPTGAISFGERFSVAATFDWHDSLDAVSYEVGISTREGQRVVTVGSVDAGGSAVPVRPGAQTVVAEFRDLTLLPGDFRVDIALIRVDEESAIDAVERVLLFTALNGQEGEDRYPWPWVRGFVRPETAWRGLEQFARS